MDVWPVQNASCRSRRRLPLAEMNLTLRWIPKIVVRCASGSFGFGMGSLQSVGIDIDSIIECLCVRALQVLVQFDTCPVFCLFFLLVQAMEWDLLVLFWWLHGSFSLFWLSFYVGTRNCSYIFVYSLFFFWVCAWVWMCMHANMHCVLLCVYASSEISSTCRVLTHRASRTGTMFLFAFFFLSGGVSFESRTHQRGA